MRSAIWPLLCLFACDVELPSEPDTGLSLAVQDPATGVDAEPTAPAPTFNNTPSCRGFIAHFNSLDCVTAGTRMDPAFQCTPQIDDVTCDQTAFWACVQEKTVCGAKGLVQPRVQDCPQPCG